MRGGDCALVYVHRDEVEVVKVSPGDVVVKHGSGAWILDRARVEEEELRFYLRRDLLIQISRSQFQLKIG